MRFQIFKNNSHYGTSVAAQHIINS